MRDRERNIEFQNEVDALMSFEYSCGVNNIANSI